MSSSDMGNGSGVVNGVSEESPSLGEGDGEGNAEGRITAGAVSAFAGAGVSISKEAVSFRYCRAVL